MSIWYRYYKNSYIAELLRLDIIIFDNGDTIIVHKQTTFENGENCIVLVDDGEYVIQKVYKTNTGIELKSVNPYYPPRIFTEREMNDLPIQVIGVVEKLIRNLKKTKNKNKKSWIYKDWLYE